MNLVKASQPRQEQPKVLHALLRVPIAMVRPHPDNVREQLGDLSEMAASIRQVGLLQPLIVHQLPGEPGYQVLAGHRRLAACRLAGLDTVDVVVRRDQLPDERLQFMLVENLHRADLNPIEEARAINQLRGMGHTQEQVARLIGKSATHVSMRLQLLSLSATDQRRVERGEIPVYEGVSIARVKSGRADVDHERGWHLGGGHRLAAAVRGLCDPATHGRKVGRVGCGECWEEVIRADERRRMSIEAKAAGRARDSD